MSRRLLYAALSLFAATATSDVEASATQIWTTSSTYEYVSGDAPTEAPYVEPASRLSRLTADVLPRVLIVQDSAPWSRTSNEDVLTSLGAEYDLVTMAGFDTTDLDQYGVVVVSSVQSTAFYDTLSARAELLEQFIFDGGVFEFHGCKQSSAAIWTGPFGITTEMAMDGTNYIVEPDHPLSAGMPQTFTGSSASHNYLINLPEDATIIVENTVGQPVTAELFHGAGMMIVTAGTWEYADYNGQSNAIMLANSLAYSLNWDPSPTALALSDTTVMITKPFTIDVTGRFTDSLSVSFGFTYDPAVIAPAENVLVSTAFDDLAGAEVLYDVVEGETIDTMFVDLSASEGPPEGVNLLARFAFETVASGQTPLTFIPDAAFVGADTTKATNGYVNVFPIPWGDVTRNGTVTSLDAATVLHNVTFQLPLPPEADVSGEEGASAYDAALILTKVVTPGFLFPIEQAARIALSSEPVELAWNRTADGWQLDADIAVGPVGALVVLRLPETATVSGVGSFVESRQGTDVRIATARLDGGAALLTVTGVESAPEIVSARVNERDARTGGTPAEFSLAQNTPNPFNPRTALRFSIAEAGAARLAIYDVNGRLVRTLVDGALTAGSHEVVWDGRDAVGREVASGVYVYRLTANERVSVRRMLLAR